MHLLIGLHAALGEAGALAFLWVLIELLNPSESRLRRARIAAALGTLLLSGAWFFGGFYYVTEYGVAVKPIIKSGPLPWTHDVITETKEHIFLFLPLLAALVWGLLSRYRNELMQNRGARIAIVLLSGFIVLIAFTIAGMGFLISSGLRAALEAKII
ncbi:MAG: hypothetical protein A2756_04480 [Candidatus Ryanbacteria bacterium RIFCSPHIGHO2_01_FULL_48_27]|uniref:Uncharacterized protein n=1 Tax=Candidatus Ryanbacteria bacterium RIFCSPHIGHO2_01_FULL_48_27 TaxID=1802115 RepID=A0A1G2G710_9BACT|nr:MAG: hypothetical protein A2756_04480 [Candidatus Ryanbacteria bacterium RIFCSPHIGHO2_01_FULL_48_27]